MEPQGRTSVRSAGTAPNPALGPGEGRSRGARARDFPELCRFSFAPLIGLFVSITEWPERFGRPGRQGGIRGGRACYHVYFLSKTPEQLTQAPGFVLRFGLPRAGPCESPDPTTERDRHLSMLPPTSHFHTDDLSISNAQAVGPAHAVFLRTAYPRRTCLAAGIHYNGKS